MTDRPFLYLASPCYGGLAHVRYLRAVLALRAACARQGIALRLDLGGGEALISRAHAGMLARFLASEATHLLFVDGDVAFDAAEIVEQLENGNSAVQQIGETLLITRDAAQRVVDARPNLRAGLGDVRGAGAPEATMLFESVIAPETGRYVADLAAFVQRWEATAQVGAPTGIVPRLRH